MASLSSCPLNRDMRINKPRRLGRGHALIPMSSTGYAYCYRCMTIALWRSPRAYEVLRAPCKNGEGWDDIRD